MTCLICNSKLCKIFEAKVLNKYFVNYELCDNCGVICANNPYWLEEAYSSPIANSDTGLVVRNLKMATKTACLAYKLLDKNEDQRFLDAAGGYGMFTRLMRDIGFNFYWSDKYAENLMARGFEANKVSEKFTLITAFEVMEHTPDPINFVGDLVAKYNPKSIIFSTQLYSGSPPSKDWWYYAFATGQHVTFYKFETLDFIAKKFGFNFYSANGIHMFTKSKINKYIYKILTSPLSYFYLIWIKLKIKSKTVTDHNRLIANNEDFI